MTEEIEGLAREAADSEAWLQEQRARTEAEEILARARARAEALRQEAVLAAKKWLAAERAKRTSEAQREILRQVLLVKHNAVKTASQKAKGRLLEIRRDPHRYAGILKALMAEAVRDMEEPVVEVSEEDLSLAEDILREMRVSGRVVASERVEGGVIARDEKRGISVYNTFSERLARARDRLLSRFSEGFGQGI